MTFFFLKMSKMFYPALTLFLLCIQNELAADLKLPVSNSLASNASRIQGGYSCSTKEYGFVVIVQGYNATHYGWRRACTSSLISPLWVLTAAHCYKPEFYQNHYMIIATASTKPKTVHVKKFHIHPNFDLNKDVLNDIGLLELEKPLLEHEDGVQYVTLPKRDLVPTDPWCAEALAMGWGFLSDSPYDLPKDNDLRCGRIPMINHRECRKVVYEAKTTRGYPGDIIIGPNTVCVFSDRIRIKPGDSGGPLMCDNVQIGIASHSASATSIVGRSVLKHGPVAVYTKVHGYLDYIDSVVKIESVKIESNRATKPYSWFIIKLIIFVIYGLL